MFYETLLSEKEALELLNQAAQAPMVAIDTETTGDNLYDGRDYCMGVSIAFRNGSRELTGFYMPFRHHNAGVMQGENYNFSEFQPLLQNIIDNSLVIYHNAKFDLVSLATLGLDTLGTAFRGRFVCTMVLSHLLDENKPLTGKSLDSCARYYLNDDKGKRKSEDLKLLIKHFGWGILTPGIIVKYAMWDAVLTYQLFEVLQPLLAIEKLQKVWAHKSNFLRLLIKMEQTGILIDQDLCREMAAEGHREMDAIAAKLGFNPGSQMQLAEFLIDEMGLPERIHPKTKRRTFDKDAMAFYEEVLSQMDNPTAKLIMDYRGWQKSVTSNYEPYVRRVSPDGRLRCNYLQHRTVTGRLSSIEPNLQQIPKSGTKPWNGQMKACFIPQPGYQLISVDFSQLELRLATTYALDPKLMEAFEAGRDIFAEMSKALGLTRDETKTLVYLIQYGGGPNKASLSFKVSVAKAREYIENFHRTYPGFKVVSNKYSAIASHFGQIQLWTGRRRHFLYPADEAHKAFNSLIQGGAADIVECALLRLDEEGFNDGDNCRILLQIHDEGLFEIKESLVEEYSRAIADSMARVNYHPRLTKVRFKAVAGLWGEK